MRILFVCTGNICRSPMAERILRARLATDSGIEVVSAGTHALVGHEMDADAARVARELGADPEGHRGQLASPELIESCELILTATTAHRDQLLTREPRAMRRMFTMREFVRLGGTVPTPASTPDGRDVAVRVAQIAGQRGQVPPPEPGRDEVGDPFAAPFAVMRSCGGAISALVDDTMQILGLAAHR